MNFLQSNIFPFRPSMSVESNLNNFDQRIYLSALMGDGLKGAMINRCNPKKRVAQVESGGPFSVHSDLPLRHIDSSRVNSCYVHSCEPLRPIVKLRMHGIDEGIKSAQEVIEAGGKL